MKTIKTNKTPTQTHTKYVSGFTLIELLIVIAIIGILATTIIISINEARTKAQIASIQGTLRNLQTTAMLYSLENNTFAGLCNYANTSFHESIQPHIDKLKSIAGDTFVKCIVRTSNVPSTNATHFVAADQLENKNFGVAVYYNERHYAVDMQGVMTIDTINTGEITSWEIANQRCANNGKRLPPIEVFKAISDYGARGGNLSFAASPYWSSTPSSSSPDFAYRQSFNNGDVRRDAATTSIHVRCAS